MQAKTTLILTLLLLSACTIPQFRSAEGDNTAQVSFSSKMPGSPELSISIDCRSYQISNKLIDKRKPAEPAKLIHQVPAGKAITLFYRNTEIGELRNVPVTKGDKKTSIYRTEIEQHHSAEICEIKTSFIPEQNKKYEIVFGATKTNQCQIYVREVINSLTAKTKKYNKVTTTATPACH